MIPRLAELRFGRALGDIEKTCNLGVCIPLHGIEVEYSPVSGRHLVQDLHDPFRVYPGWIPVPIPFRCQERNIFLCDNRPVSRKETDTLMDHNGIHPLSQASFAPVLERFQMPENPYKNADQYILDVLATEKIPAGKPVSRRVQFFKKLLLGLPLLLFALSYQEPFVQTGDSVFTGNPGYRKRVAWPFLYIT